MIDKSEKKNTFSLAEQIVMFQQKSTMFETLLSPLDTTLKIYCYIWYGLEAWLSLVDCKLWKFLLIYLICFRSILSSVDCKLWKFPLIYLICFRSMLSSVDWKLWKFLLIYLICFRSMLSSVDRRLWKSLLIYLIWFRSLLSSVDSRQKCLCWYIWYVLEACYLQ